MNSEFDLISTTLISSAIDETPVVEMNETPETVAEPTPTVQPVKAAPSAKVVAEKPVQTELAVDAAQDVQALAEPKSDADKPETEDEADKPVRPRRPRGRPPKKATPASES